MKYLYSVYDDELLVLDHEKKGKVIKITGASNSHVDTMCETGTPYKGRFKVIKHDMIPDDEIVEELKNYCQKLTEAIGSENLSKIKFTLKAS